MDIYIHREDRRYGPYTGDQLHRMLADGSVTREDLASRGGDERIPVARLLEESPPPAPEIAVTAADLAGNSTPPRIWNPNHADLVSGVFCVLVGGLFSLLGPVIHALNWHRLGRRGEAMMSWGWAAVFALVLLILSLLWGDDFDYTPGTPSGIMFILMIVWHLAQGRSQARFVKGLPAGSVRFRSCMPLVLGSLVLTAVLAVLAILVVMAGKLQDDAREVLNERLRAAMGSDALECVEVRLGDEIASGLHEATAILDNGQTVMITVRRLDDDRVSVRVNPDSLRQMLPGEPANPAR